MLNQIFSRAEVMLSPTSAFERQDRSLESHIVIVDDDEAVRAVVSFALLQAGYKVTTLKDGLAALQRVSDNEPDLIILDLMLPGMEGIELCWRIREFSKVPIVILSALEGDADKVWALKAGADDYVTKPFSTRELLARIEAILRRRSPI